MTGFEISSIILISAIAVGFIVGFCSEGGGKLNTYEKLYATYKESKFKLKELDLQLMREETKQLTLRLKHSDEDS